MNYEDRGKQELQSDEKLKNFDNLLYDLLKSDPDRQPKNIPHINQRNSQQSMNVMRGTRE